MTQFRIPKRSRPLYLSLSSQFQTPRYHNMTGVGCGKKEKHSLEGEGLKSSRGVLLVATQVAFVEKNRTTTQFLSSLSLSSSPSSPLARPHPQPTNSHPLPQQQVPSTPLKVTTKNGNIVITPPVKNFTAVDPTVNATAYPVPTWARLTAKEKTLSTQGQAVLNATGYPFVYGYVPPPGTLKNTTNATLKAVGVVGTSVNATATALNFTSPVAGLGNDLAQAINNAIKVRLFFGRCCCRIGERKGRREKEHNPLTSRPPLSTTATPEIKKMAKKNFKNRPPTPFIT